MEPINKIKLNRDHNTHILTKDAAALIQQATYLHISFQSRNGQPVENYCWLRLGNKVVNPATKQEAEIHYEMPINITGIDLNEADWSFSHIEYTTGHTQHPLKALAKKDTYIEFHIDYDAGTSYWLRELEVAVDIIYWKVSFPKAKPVQEVFIKNPKRVSERMVTKIEHNQS